jgi:hypothetical protein
LVGYLDLWTQMGIVASASAIPNGFHGMPRDPKMLCHAKREQYKNT